VENYPIIKPEVNGFFMIQPATLSHIALVLHKLVQTMDFLLILVFAFESNHPLILRSNS